MKKTIIYFSLLFVALFITSCDKWIDPDINLNPDALTEPSISILLPSAEASLAYLVGGVDVAGTQAVWAQQLEGTDRQFKAINKYVMRQSNINNLWTSMYDVLNDLKIMIDLAENGESKSKNVAGVGKILTAVALGNLTDVFGDIPYSEALQGKKNLTPKYDSQEEIYNTIFRLLNEAIADLASDENLFPIAPDYIYGGDAAAWTQAAHMLKARYAMHLTGKGGVNFDNVIADIDAGFADNGSDMEVPFSQTPDGANPMYQFIDQRSGYIEFHGQYDTVFLNGDPRNGAINYSSGSFWVKSDAPVAFVQYTEGLFIKAEAQLNSDVDAAKATLKAAIRSSLAKYGVSDDAWLATQDAAIDATTEDNMLKMIIEHKYRHMFLQPEVFVDIRRTGFPVLTPVAGDKIPSHYPYPTGEHLYNEANVPDITLFTKMWWMP